MQDVVSYFHLNRSLWLLKAAMVMMGGRRLLRASKYNPNQPRVPAGRSDGGRWTDGNSDGAEAANAGSNDVYRISPAHDARHRRRLARVIYICILSGLAKLSHGSGPIEYSAAYDCADGRTLRRLYFTPPPGLIVDPKKQD